MADDALAALRPPHWPDAMPVTTATDLLTAAVVGAVAAVLVVAIAAVLRRARRPSPRSETLERVAAARRLRADARMAAFAAALRDHVRATTGAEAARTEGEAWLGVLDRQFATDGFSRGDGRLLVEGLYRPATEDEAEQVGRFLDQLLRSKG